MLLAREHAQMRALMWEAEKWKQQQQQRYGANVNKYQRCN